MTKRKQPLILSGTRVEAKQFKNKHFEQKLEFIQTQTTSEGDMGVPHTDVFKVYLQDRSDKQIDPKRLKQLNTLQTIINQFADLEGKEDAAKQIQAMYSEGSDFMKLNAELAKEWNSMVHRATDTVPLSLVFDIFNRLDDAMRNQGGARYVTALPDKVKDPLNERRKYFKTLNESYNYPLHGDWIAERSERIRHGRKPPRGSPGM